MIRFAAGLATLLLFAVGAASGAGRPPSESERRLFIVPVEGDPAIALEKADARKVAAYESFTLVEATGKDADRLERSGAQPRDDMTEVQIGERLLDPATDRRPLVAKGDAPSGPGLAIVQFVGPIKDAWLARLRATGVRVVTYMAQNAYLVHGSAAELDRAGTLSGSHHAVRAVVAYSARDKVDDGVRSSGRQRLAIQTLTGPGGAPTRTRVTTAGERARPTTVVGAFRTQYVEMDAGEASDLATAPGVIAVLPAPAPELLDESQDQILAGNTIGADPLLPAGVGYLGFLDGLVGTTQFPFAVDVTDSGMDAGFVTTQHPDLHQNGDLGLASRISYADDFTTDVGVNEARDCGGHGTINLGIVGGFNNGRGTSGPTAPEDASGFNYGLGVAPRTLLGGSKIFRCDGDFSLVSSFSALTENAYAKGARISSNSWGCSVCAGEYNADSQEYDALVRDASSATTGNQQMVEVFSAGNDGPGGTSIGPPGTAKNVLTVGASEGVRPIGGTDGCGITDSGADDAHDVIGFSSRGPVDDLRRKPDVVGPGTHITGPEPQHAAFVGDRVCSPNFPLGNSFYTESSGTSHSTPAVAGMAALLRQWYTNTPIAGNGTPPSPAMTKAVLAQSGTDLVGGSNGAGGFNSNLPDQVQGWGLPNLKRSLSTTGRFFHDQQTNLAASGEFYTQNIAVGDSTKPVKVTLAWTDPPGPTTGNSYVNDLNLSVTSGPTTYLGNVFSGGQSTTGGSADPRNNLESVYLPAGTSGTLTLRVDAANIAGDGVPGNADTTDQDFALTASNGEPAATPSLSHESTSITDQDSSGTVEPGEAFGVSETVRNTGPIALTGIAGTLTGPDVSDGTTGWPDLTPDQSAANSAALGGTLSAGATCGAPLNLALSITTAEGATVERPISIPGGGTAAAPTSIDSTDVQKALVDGGTVTSTLTVPTAGAIKDVDVRIPGIPPAGGLAHTWVGDLKIDLVAPDGTSVNLVNRPGGSNNDDNNLANIEFDDEAATAVGPPNPGANATPAYTGTFKPQADQLSRFDGGPQDGTWTLRIQDLEPTDTGTLHAWGTDASRAVCGSAPTQRTLNVSLAGTGAGSITGPGLGCPGDCVETYADGAGVALTATPTAASSFTGWGGDCSGTGTCSLNMSADRSVTATFTQDGYYPPPGGGSVGGSGSGTPGAVAGLSATPGVKSVALDWTETPNATSYYIWHLNPDGSVPALPTAEVSSSRSTDRGLPAGARQCYQVQARNSAGTGPLSGPACATPFARKARLLDLSDVPRTIRVDRQGRFTLEFDTVGAGSLTLTTLKAFTAASKRKLALATRQFSAPSASKGHVRMRLRLTRRHRRVLRRVRKVSAALRVEVGTAHATRTVKLKAPRPRRRRNR